MLFYDNLKKAGWSLGYVSAIDSNGRTIWIADARHSLKSPYCLCVSVTLPPSLNTRMIARFE